MNENSNENTNSQNGEVEEVQALDENETDVEVIKAHAKEVEDRNRQLYARAKKAEGFIQDKDGKWVKPSIPPKNDEETKKPETTTKEDTSELSQSDLITLMKADVHQDDISELVEYAKFKKITVAEALTHSVMKGILADKAEARKVAQGTNTGGGKRGNAKMSDETLLENARKGIYPENEADMARLTVLARTQK